MRRFFDRATVFIATLILLALMLSLLSSLTVRKEAYVNSKPFYEHSEQYDILFFGTSHVRNGILPLELWMDFGYVSYNLASSGATLPMSYWSIVNALDYSEPQLLVLDCCRVSHPDISSGVSYVHTMTDSMPLSSNKIRAAFDLGGDTSYALELLCPFSIYHARWEELSMEDFSPKLSVTHGVTLSLNVAVPNEFALTDDSMALTEEMTGVAYLEKIIQLCRSRNIQLLLTYLPYPATLDEVKEANGLAKLARKYGVDYINFLTMDTVDLDTDMYDSFSHLNYSGAQKVSRYIGNYISQHYDIPDRREDEGFSWMGEDLSEYQAYLEDLLRNESYLFNYLLLLRQYSAASAIYVAEDSPVYDNETILKLIENVPLAAKPNLLRQAAQNKTDYLLFVNNADGEIQEYLGEDIPKVLDTGIGTLNIDSFPIIGCQVYNGNTGESLGCDRSFHEVYGEGYVREY